MGTVTAVFARTLIRAIGLRLEADGSLYEGNRFVLRLAHEDGKLTDTDYFELVDWVRLNARDRAGVAFAYAQHIDIDTTGALGLAMKTAPTLRDSLHRIERYFRLLTDTATYHLDETSMPCLFTMVRRTEDHPALHLRNECALGSFAHLFKTFIGDRLSYAYVSFAHDEPEASNGRYEDFFGCPVRFGAERNAIAIHPDMLDLATRLGDAAVSRFLTEHLDSELGTLAVEDRFEQVLAKHLSEALSNGIPKAANVAREIGVSERTLRRRLSESGLTYQAVLENTQKSLAENLLSQSSFSISDVAFLTGFAEQSSFNRAFKRWVGKTPGAYRAKC